MNLSMASSQQGDRGNIYDNAGGTMPALRYGVNILDVHPITLALWLERCGGRGRGLASSQLGDKLPALPQRQLELAEVALRSLFARSRSSGT